MVRWQQVHLGHPGEMHLAQDPPCCVRPCRLLASVLRCRHRTLPHQLACHSPVLSEAVSSAGQGGSEENPILLVVIFACEGNCHQLPPERAPMQPSTAAGKAKSRWPCWPRFQPDCLEGVGGVQEQNMLGRGARATTSCHLCGVLPIGGTGLSSRASLWSSPSICQSFLERGHFRL